MKNHFLLIFSFLLLTSSFLSCDSAEINTKDSQEAQSEVESDSIEVNTTDSQETEKPEIENSIEEKTEVAAEETIDQEILVDPGPDPSAGEEIFNNTCASCHGISGMGDGVAAAGLMTKPRNLGNSEYVEKLSDEHLYKVINEGGSAAGLSALMPPWKGILTDQDIKDVISHIRTNICKCNKTQQENPDTQQ